MAALIATSALLSMLTLVLFAQSIHDSNESKLKQSHKLHEYSETQFRSKKANLIWELASKTFLGDEVRLDALYPELKDLDMELMKLKALKHNNEDPYGETENAINEKIADLMRRFELSKPFETVYSSEIKTTTDLFESKLQAMLKDAKRLGFTGNELKDLETEIGHHRIKMAEVAVLEEQLKKAEEKLQELPNAIDRDSHKHLGVHAIKEMKENLKERQKELYESMNRLSLLSDSPPLSLDSAFSNPKIIQLWAGVLRANFTLEEQQSLKEELMHLEKKISKRDKIAEDESLLRKKSLEIQGDPDYSDLHERTLKKHEDTKEKKDQIDRLVKKHTRDIEQRISSKIHIEL